MVLPELTRWEEVLRPGFDVTDGAIKTRTDHAALPRERDEGRSERERGDGYLVQTTIEVDNDLAAAVIIDDFEFADVT